jgi:hypothetical protein
MALLDRVAALELLPIHIRDHIIPYASRHAIDLSRLLFDYCSEQIESACAGFDLLLISSGIARHNVV